MTKEKQIDEMAKVYEEARYKANETLGSMNEGADKWYANAFYNAGYRKSSNVAREIFEEISKASVNWGCYCITTSKAGFLTSDVNRTLAELKKKYTVEGK